MEIGGFLSPVITAAREAEDAGRKTSTTSTLSGRVSFQHKVVTPYQAGRISSTFNLVLIRSLLIIILVLKSQHGCGRLEYE